jgi:ADP-ribose pyrophosphatase
VNDDSTTDRLAWETREADTAYTCPGFDVIHEDVRLPDGTETAFDSINEPAAVVVLPFTPNEQVVVIDEWRQAVKRVNRGFPAGSVEPDENPEESVRRELEEETGHVPERVEHLTTVEPLNGLADSVHHHFVAHGCQPTGEQCLDDDESIQVDTVDFEELFAALADDELRDGRSALCLLYYARFGEGENGAP